MCGVCAVSSVCGMCGVCVVSSVCSVCSECADGLQYPVTSQADGYRLGCCCALLG